MTTNLVKQLNCVMAYKIIYAGKVIRRSGDLMTGKQVEDAMTCYCARSYDIYIYDAACVFSVVKSCGGRYGTAPSCAPRRQEICILYFLYPPYRTQGSQSKSSGKEKPNKHIWRFFPGERRPYPCVEHGPYVSTEYVRNGSHAYTVCTSILEWG